MDEELVGIDNEVHTDEYYKGYCEGWKKGWIECAIDSEGCLSLNRFKRYNQSWYNYSPALTISNSSLTYLEVFNDLVDNTGSINIDNLRFSSYALRKLLPNISLIVKDKQRLLLLEALDILHSESRQGKLMVDVVHKALDSIYYELKELNSGKGKPKYHNDYSRYGY